MLKAALSHFIAERDRAVANLNNLLRNPAGIGEHPDVIAAIDTQISAMANAQEKLEVIKSFEPEKNVL